MSISKNSKNLQLDTKRHSFAHLMAATVGQMFPEAQFGVGPVIENGCYYDFILPRTLIPEDLPLLEKRIKDMLKQPLVFKVQEVELPEAIALFEKMNQPLKVELLNDLATRGTTSMSEEEVEAISGDSKDVKITIYRLENEKTGEDLFVDLCKGPHIESIKELSQIQSPEYQIQNNFKPLTQENITNGEGLASSILKNLKNNSIKFELKEHPEIASSEDSAKFTGVKIQQGVKALILVGKASGKYYQFNLPADQKLDLKKVEELVKEKCEMAKAEQIQEKFGLEIGGIAPFGTLLGIPTYFDSKILLQEKIAFATGLKTQSVVMNSQDLLDLNQAKIKLFSKSNLKPLTQESITNGEGLASSILKNLKANQIQFRHLEHEETPTSKDSAKARGTTLEEGVKSLILVGKASGQHYQFNLPSNLKIDLKKVQKITQEECELEKAEVIKEKFGLEIGGIPPFGKLLNIKTYFDKNILLSKKAAFNCGLKTQSVVMSSQDLLDLNQAQVESFSKNEQKVQLGFKLDKFSGSYWRGDQERNIQMQRIYALVFDTKEELKEFEEKRKLAQERDHRKLGKELEIFMVSDEVGSGLPLYLPNGAAIRQLLEKYCYQEAKKAGYQYVYTPHIGKEDLFSKSGHLSHYRDGMFAPIDMVNLDGEGADETGKTEKFYLKPMNCPMHHNIYLNTPKSYRDLPYRLYEYGTVYRYEESGTLSGMIRVRGFTQNDAHVYCQRTQLKEVIGEALNRFTKAYNDIGITDYKIRFSLPDFVNEPEKFGEETEEWRDAVSAMRQALDELNVDYYDAVGEAAFYGPKIDIQVKNVNGKEDSLSTIQVDYSIAPKFGITFKNEKGEDEVPAIIHMALMGSVDRFMAFMLEMTGGRLPLWLAPTQVKILTINNEEATMNYVAKIKQILDETVLMKPLKYNEIRYEVDDRNESLGKKIREATKAKIPVQLIVGPKDIEAGEVSVRLQSGEEKVRLEGLREFLEKIN